MISTFFGKAVAAPCRHVADESKRAIKPFSPEQLSGCVGLGATFPVDDHLALSPEVEFTNPFR